MAGGQLPAWLKPSGALTNYTPTLREKFISKLAKHWYGDTRQGYRQAGRFMDVADLTPVGMATGMYDAGRAIGQGNNVQGGFMAAMAGLPVPGALKKELKGIKAFHGSPHSFDRFDMSKIGSGEGAQAYGHGLYFADQEATAKAYRNSLSPKFNTATAQAALDKFGGDRVKAAELLRAQGNPGTRLGDYYEALAKKVERGEPLGGSMYEVNIDADPEQFLDWDKPLSEQPSTLNEAYPSLQGETLQQAFPHGVNPAVGNTMKQAGIPGIKYLDQGSRDPVKMKELADDLAQYRLAAVDHARTGNTEKLKIAQKQIEVLEKRINATRNYVVFDDKLVKIMRKYGIGGLIGIGAGAKAMQQPEQDRTY